MSTTDQTWESIDQQYERAANKCNSYSACSGCMTTLPKPSDFDLCYDDPMACMEETAEGLLRMREDLRPLGPEKLQAMKKKIRKGKDMSDDDAAALMRAEAKCMVHTTDINVIHWCNETLNNATVVEVEEAPPPASGQQLKKNTQ